MHYLERRMSRLQEALLTSQQQAKMVMGSLNLLGSCASLLALKFQYFGATRNALGRLVAVLSAANMLVGFLNLATSASSAADWAVQRIRVGVGGACRMLWEDIVHSIPRF